MHNVIQLFLAANTILLMRKWNHACFLLVYVISVITPGRQHALTAFRRYYLLKNKLSDRMIKKLLNLVIAKYREMSVASRSIICRSIFTLLKNRGRTKCQKRYVFNSPIFLVVFSLGQFWLDKAGKVQKIQAVFTSKNKGFPHLYDQKFTQSYKLPHEMV